jgi:hypothetical protein
LACDEEMGHGSQLLSWYSDVTAFLTASNFRCAGFGLSR